MSSDGTEEGEDVGPPSNLPPDVVANQVERIIDKNTDGLSAYEKSWLQNAADYLRHLSTGDEGRKSDKGEYQDD